MMKRIVLMLLAALALQGAEINWLYSYEEGAKAAREQHKPMLLFMNKVNSRAGDYLKEQVFTDEGVVLMANKYYVPVSLNITNSDVPANLRVQDAPVFHFVDVDGEKLEESIQGAKNAGILVVAMKRGAKAYKKGHH